MGWAEVFPTERDKKSAFPRRQLRGKVFSMQR